MATSAIKKKKIRTQLCIIKSAKVIQVLKDCKKECKETVLYLSIYQTGWLVIKPKSHRTQTHCHLIHFLHLTCHIQCHQSRCQCRADFLSGHCDTANNDKCQCMPCLHSNSCISWKCCCPSCSHIWQAGSRKKAQEEFHPFNSQGWRVAVSVSFPPMTQWRWHRRDGCHTPSPDSGLIVCPLSM